MKKRKLFSQKDGTDFLTDISDISEEVKAFFNSLPLELKKLLPIAEDIVRALQVASDAVKDGSPLDQALQKALDLTKTEADNKIYEVVKNAVELFLDRVAPFLNMPQLPILAGEFKKQSASMTLRFAESLTQVQADTAIQLAVYAVKS